MAGNNMCAVILAAGKSSRMNKPKALLPISGRQSFLSHLVTLYNNTTGTKPVVVVNVKLFSDSRFRRLANAGNFIPVVNQFPEKGRFYSIWIGLKAVPEFDYVFVHDVDRPIIKKSTLLALASIKFSEGFSVPSYNGFNGHPILLGKKLKHFIQNCKPEKKILNTYLKGFEKKIVPVKDKGVHLNINTPEEYKRIIDG